MSTYDELFNCNDVIGDYGDEEMRAYTADFETTTDPEDCRVWAWGVYSIGADCFITYGNCLETFVDWLSFIGRAKVYFHNLGFDGAFLMDWLLKHGWRHSKTGKYDGDRTFATLISDMNQVYSIKMFFTKSDYVEIQDSLKIIPMSIAAMAKAYGLEIRKGSIDYEEYRAPGHELTAEELAYLKNDVEIAAKSLSVYLNQGLSKMTAGSNALYDYKKMLGGHKKFRYVYPLLDEKQDAFLRKAYRGGFTYVNPKYQGIDVGEGIVLDVNSLYPSVMAACDGQLLPVYQPVWFDGEPEPDDDYPLWVALVSVSFRVKPDHIPCLQLKGNFLFKQTEYVTDSNGVQSICVTNVDWELMQQQYDLECVEFFGGYKFRASTCQFREYVDKWVQVKNQATIDGNSGIRSVAKLMLNSLYGKFATRMEVRGRHPEIDEGGVLRYRDDEPETRDPVYLPVGIFITSWARYKTITSAQSVYDRFVYADTDSLHLVGTDIPENLDVDPVRLGAWKHESTFDHGKFLRAKTYVEHEVGADHLTVRVAGLPYRCHEYVTLDNFEFGAKYKGNLTHMRVPGGIVLVDSEKEIRK